LIGLSPLSTAHPSSFQPTTVRASTRCYPSFTLAMDRSLRFRVCPHVLSIALFRLAFATATALKALTSHVRRNSPDHNAKGTPSPTSGPPKRPDQAPTACMHTVSGSLSLAVRRSFHPSLTVLSTIGHGLVFSLGGWSPQIQPGFLVPRPTRVSSPSKPTGISHTGLSPPSVRRSRRVPLCQWPRRAMPQLNPTTPQRRKPPRFRLFPLRSPLLRESHI
jgi:hypothetical protein